jgi:hypothetical protein
VGEEGYRDWRLDASSNSKDFLWMIRARVIPAGSEPCCLAGEWPRAIVKTRGPPDKISYWKKQQRGSQFTIQMKRQRVWRTAAWVHAMCLVKCTFLCVLIELHNNASKYCAILQMRPKWQAGLAQTACPWSLSFQQQLCSTT